MYCIVFTNYIFLCKNLASYLKEYKATCSFNTNIYSFMEFSMCMIIAPFWQQYKISITHSMLCRDLIFWKTYCMIEGRQHRSIKRRKTTFLRKERCMFRGLLYWKDNVRILFLEKSNAFPRRKIAAYEWKVYFDMKIFARAALYLADECLRICMGA